MHICLCDVMGRSHAPLHNTLRRVAMLSAAGCAAAQLRAQERAQACS